MEIKTTAFVLACTDYKENDKLLTLFSAERGKMTAALRGAKKPTAKLKFAAQPFLLGEFILAEKNGFFTVTGASAIDAFYALRADVEKFYAASCMAETLRRVLQEDQPEFALFSALGTAFKLLSYEKTDAKLYLIRFLLTALFEQGVGVDFSACKACGKEAENYAFSFRDGGVYCKNCRPADAVPLKSEVSDLLSAVFSAEAEELIGKKADPVAERGALRLLGDFFAEHVGEELVSLSQYLTTF